MLTKSEKAAVVLVALEVAGLIVLNRGLKRYRAKAVETYGVNNEEELINKLAKEIHESRKEIESC